MSRPRLAMLIPAYNAESHLPRLLESARAQTVPFDEILVYDDASTDRTGDIARSYGARVVRGEENRGCSFGKNTLASLTECEWVHFHDADDALLPHFVETARRWIDADTHDVVLFGYEERDHESGHLLSIRRFSQEITAGPIAFAIREQINPFCGVYRRRTFIDAGGYDLDPEVLFNEDVALHCRLALARLRFASDATVTVVNFRRRDSMSAGSPARCLRAHYHVMRKMAEATGRTHAAAIAGRLWITAAGSASYLDWETADAAVALARQLAGPVPGGQGRIFSGLCRLDARAALRMREYLIRVLKPRFRRGYPRLFGAQA